MGKGEKVVVDPIQQAQELSENLTNLMLRDTIDKLEEQKVKLLLNIKGLIEKLTQQKSDQADIYYYLNKKLDDNYEIVSSLEEQMLAEQTDREMCEKAFERKIEGLKAKFVIEDQKSHAKIVELEEKIQVLKDFSDQKQDMDDQLHKLLETLENERKQYAASMMDVERKWNFDREKTKREYEESLEVLRNEVQTTVNSKLTAETINTKRLNTYIKDELKYQSGQAELVLTVNENVMQRDKELKVELSLAQSNEQEILARLVMFQRMTKQLNARINQEEEKNRVADEVHEKELAAKDKDMDKLNKVVFDWQEKERISNLQLDSLWKALSETYATVQQNQNTVNTEGHPNHDVVLCEVFRRMLKKYPARFKKLLNFGVPPAFAGGANASVSMDGYMGSGSVALAGIIDAEDSSLLRLPSIANEASTVSNRMTKRDNVKMKNKKVFRSVDDILSGLSSSMLTTDSNVTSTGIQAWDQAQASELKGMIDDTYPGNQKSVDSVTTTVQHGPVDDTTFQKLTGEYRKPLVLDAGVQTEGHVSIVYSNSSVWNSISAASSVVLGGPPAVGSAPKSKSSQFRRNRYTEHPLSDSFSNMPQSPASPIEVLAIASGQEDGSSGSSTARASKLSVPPLMPLQKSRTIQKANYKTSQTFKEKEQLRNQIDYQVNEKASAFAKSTLFSPANDAPRNELQQKKFRKKKITPFPNSKPVVSDKGVTVIPYSSDDDQSVESIEISGAQAKGSIKIPQPPPNSTTTAKKVSKSVSQQASSGEE